nr:hypothetical protein Itr_chr04CG13410 [Ipomoea trifida]
MLVDQSFSPETGERDRTTGGDSPSLLLADEGTAMSERGLSCHPKPRRRPDRTWPVAFTPARTEDAEEELMLCEAVRGSCCVGEGEVSPASCHRHPAALFRRSTRRET